MPFYLIRASMTAETWAALMNNPEDRRVASHDIEGLIGAKLHGYWYALGQHDVYSLIEAPDHEAICTLLAAQRASGAFSSIETVVLVSVDEMLAALGRARTFPYYPPGRRPE